uniref:Uncharacterized protein n=1 Tax=Agrobacterium tumefaciens TaxID=358 RepID=A0A2Z2PP22_AGRTU|nr:hypothetical protein [Agrobacterium tumefaciens]
MQPLEKRTVSEPCPCAEISRRIRGLKILKVAIVQRRGPPPGLRFAVRELQCLEAPERVRMSAWIASWRSELQGNPPPSTLHTKQKHGDAENAILVESSSALRDCFSSSRRGDCKAGLARRLTPHLKAQRNSNSIVSEWLTFF